MKIKYLRRRKIPHGELNLCRPVWTSSAYFVYGNKNIQIHAVISGEPAKIIVSCSHKKIAADRGSVAIIMADIADSRGNHISGARNILKWNISGPANLVGPAYYVSYADRTGSRTRDGTWKCLQQTL